MNKILWILIVIASITFLGSWAICDILYWEKAKYWRQLFEPLGLTANPYIKQWGLLRWKLFGIERVCWILSLLLFVPSKIKPYLIILLDFALGNVIDRVFFNYETFNWNDLVIWIFALVYGFKSFFPKQYLVVYLFLEPYLILPFIFVINKCKSAWHKIKICWTRS